MQHLANSGRCVIGGLDETEAIFRGKITLCTRVFCDHRATQRQKSRSPIADPAGPPRHVNALNRSELSKRAGEVAAVRPRRAREVVWIDNVPAEPAQSFSFGILRSDVHR